jgi:hypothetical protein
MKQPNIQPLPSTPAAALDKLLENPTGALVPAGDYSPLELRILRGSVSARWACSGRWLSDGYKAELKAEADKIAKQP